MSRPGFARSRSTTHALPLPELRSGSVIVPKSAILREGEPVRVFVNC